MSQSWKSQAWRGLPLYNSSRTEKQELRDEEEDHELLTSPDRSSNEDEFDQDTNAAYRRSRQEPALFWSDSDRKNGSRCAERYASIVAATLLLIVLIAGLGIISSTTTQMCSGEEISRPPSSLGSATDKAKIVRQEWRRLTTAQQQSYISALKCLQSLPPLLPHMPPNASSYSDYPYVHAHIGYRTHNSASFLPWHRYFLHLFESRLRTDCGYDGGIPYWDWTLDAEDLASSPVISADNGFGGDGDPAGDITVGRHGRCVVDGPFAGLQVLWYDVKYQPHCLSRGFRTDEAGGNGRMDGSALSPEEIDRILDLDGYEDFVPALEKKVHDVIPFGVGGDFETFSAPFEPLFWLHHSQLDRLWWLWQKERDERIGEYGGHRFRHSIEAATLDDKVEVGGVLGRDVMVRDLVSVDRGCEGHDNGLLCYSYDG